MQYDWQTMGVSDLRTAENILAAEYCVKIIPEEMLDESHAAKLRL